MLVSTEEASMALQPHARITAALLTQGASEAWLGYGFLLGREK